VAILQSRVMEMFIMLDLTIDRKVPIEVIVDFFRPIPGFDEEYTREMVKDLIARDYDRMAFSTLENRAPEFYDGSDIYT
jgi:DNA primase large subunit